MEKLAMKKSEAENSNAEDSFVRDLGEQIDSIKANLDYIQDNIGECQDQIVQLEDRLAF